MRGAVIASGLGIAAVAGAGSGWLAVSAWRDNRTIAGLAAGRDLPVGAGASAAVLFARADFLLARDRIDEAQALVPDIRAAGDQGRLADLQYNIANGRLRAAFGLLEQNRIDPAIPLVRLAKDGYRATLTIAPGHWDARYNLDVAMRLVRDLPRNGQDLEEDAPPEPPKQLWTDLPGLPKGLP
jgi:mxaK protein